MMCGFFFFFLVAGAISLMAVPTFFLSAGAISLITPRAFLNALDWRTMAEDDH